MPLLFIHVRDSEFSSRDEGGEYADAETALAIGLKSAVSMAADEIGRGNRNAAIEVSVEAKDGTRLLTSVVTLAIAPLLVTGSSTRKSDGDGARGDGVDLKTAFVDGIKARLQDGGG